LSDKAEFFDEKSGGKIFGAENLVGASDWAAIEAAYRADKPLRAISEQFGVGKDAIARKAKRERWHKSATSPATDPRQERDKVATSDAVLPVVSPAVSSDSDFDWDAADIVVLHKQPQTALYFNPNGALVIRQQNWPEDDVFVFIAREYLDSFVDKLTDMLGIPSVGRREY
jgi:hypothetical protein